MNDYLVQEEYKEYTVGVRVIRVQAESKQHVLDGDYENIDVIDELTASGDVEETNLIDSTEYQEILKFMKEKLIEWQIKNEDTFRFE